VNQASRGLSATAELLVVLVKTCYVIACWQDTDFEVQGLTEHKDYLFRVAAANANGTGDWVEMPSPITAKMPFGK